MSDSYEVDMLVCAFGGTVVLEIDTNDQHHRFSMTTERARGLVRRLMEAVEHCERRAQFRDEES